MTKRFEPVGAVIADRIQKLVDEFHSELEGARIGALFVFDDEDPTAPLLKHQGYFAAATVRIVGLRDRAQGLPDAQIVIDRATWNTLDARQQRAVLDHELQHLEPKLDKHGHRLFDPLDRLRLQMRKHDWHFGWFNSIAERHGSQSMEVLQARRLVQTSGQLYFSFDAPKDQAA